MVLRLLDSCENATLTIMRDTLKIIYLGVINIQAEYVSMFIVNNSEVGIEPSIIMSVKVH